MQDKDNFWNLDKILPPKKKISTPPQVNCEEVSTLSPSQSSGVDIRVLISALNEKRGVNSFEDAIVKEKDYSHFKNSNVINFAYVGAFNNSFTYENKIRDHALSLYNKKADTEPQFCEYFSFTPTFYELSHNQLVYYIYLRENIRRGSFIKATPSYILLFATEIINLPDKIPPDKGLSLLITLWEKYLITEKRYSKTMSDLIFDYSLVHDLPIPYERLSNILIHNASPVSTMLSNLFVFDYLLISKKDLTENDYAFLFEKTLFHNFRLSKHYKENTEFSKLIDEYFYPIISEFFKSFPEYLDEIFIKHKKRSAPIKTVRPAYVAFNTSSAVKKNLVFEYYQYEKTDIELDVLVTVAKHVENKFRAMCAIRARLSANALPLEAKNVLNKIFAQKFQNVCKYADSPALTPAPHTISVDLKKAKHIENASWETTEKLIEGVEIFYDDEDKDFSNVEYVDAYGDDASLTLDKIEKDVLSLIVKKDIRKAHETATQNGMFLDGVILTINEKFQDFLGDIVIDPQAKQIYPEYENEAYSALNKEK